MRLSRHNRPLSRHNRPLFLFHNLPLVQGVDNGMTPSECGQTEKRERIDKSGFQNQTPATDAI